MCLPSTLWSPEESTVHAAIELLTVLCTRCDDCLAIAHFAVRRKVPFTTRVSCILPSADPSSHHLAQVLFADLPVALTSVDCNGTEASISECRTSKPFIAKCDKTTTSTVLACSDSSVGEIARIYFALCHVMNSLVNFARQTLQHDQAMHCGPITDDILHTCTFRF